MPEPAKVAEGEQGAQTATTPQVADKPETTTQSEGQSSSKAVMDLLDIPEELQNTVLPPEVPEPKTEETPEPEKEEETPEVKGEEEEPQKDESEEEESDEEDEEENKPEQKIDKRQKRINRLTRQRSELERQVDERDSTIEELQTKLQKFEKNGAPPVGTIPQVGPWLPDKETAESYSDLSSKKKTAEATLAWCDKYSDGVNITDNGKERFVSPEEITSERRKAQMALMEINPEIKVIEREARQAFKQHQANFDKAADTFWPDLNDKSSEAYQLSKTLLDEFPSVKHSPQAKYAIGLVIEGMRSLNQRIQAQNNKNGNGQGKKHKDIDERVFTTPRVPIAPHAPESASRESVPSSQKKLNEATNSFMTDPDGSAESLSKVFQARAEAGSKPNSRSPVKV